MFRFKNSLVFVKRAYSQAKGPQKLGLIPGPKDHSCGIPPWDPQLEIPPPPPPKELPAHLIRGPCIKGATPGPVQECLRGMRGMYCPPCRLKFKYPPFSENIEQLPSSEDPPCWWKRSPTCGKEMADTDVLKHLTRGWECNID